MAGFLAAAEGGNAACIDEHERAIGKGYEQTVALSDVNRGEFEFSLLDERGKGMDDDGGQRAAYNQRGGNVWPAAMEPQRAGNQGKGEQCRQPERGRGNAPRGLPTGVPVDGDARNVEQPRTQCSDAVGVGGDSEESEWNDDAHYRDDDRVGGKPGRGQAVEIDNHRQCQPDLDEE